VRTDFRSAYDADQVLPKPKAGEVWVYSRLSDRTKGKEAREAGEVCAKSIADQNRVSRRIAERYQLPLADACFLSDNKSGRYWWSGVNLGIGANKGTSECRDGMSRLRDLILDGKVKAIVTYSQCRLFRGAAMADAWMDLCVAHGVRIYDSSSGLLDIWSPDGKAYIRFLANDNQRQREKSGVESARGIESCLEQGDLCVRGGILGFRSEGRRSKKVRVVSDEIAWVKWIFQAYCYGIDERGPLSISVIANELCRDPGFQWMPDVVSSGGRRTPATKDNVYPSAVRNVLKDVRYRGLQQKNGKIFLCNAFLVNGEPVIDEKTFSESEKRRKTRSRFPKGRGRDRYPFSGVLRCHCGQQLAATDNRPPNKGANERRINYWRYSPTGQFTCRHWMPALAVKEMDRYYIETLVPILQAELSARESASNVAALVAERTVLFAEIADLDRYRETDLVDYSLQVSPQLAAAMEARIVAKAESAHQRVKQINELLESDESLGTRLENAEILSDSMLSEIVRRTVLWAAVLPNPSLTGGRMGRRSKDTFVAKILFCLGYGGVFHTAVVERHGGKDPRAFTYQLRPALEDECVGTINDLPDPVAFATRVLGNAITVSAYYRDWRPSDVAIDDWIPGIDPEYARKAKQALSITT